MEDVINKLKNDLQTSIEINKQILEGMEDKTPREVFAYHTGFIHGYERILKVINQIETQDNQ